MTPLRVLLDATYAERAPHSGTGVYIEQLTAALRVRDDVEVVRVANANRGAPGGGGGRSALNLLADYRWTAFALPALARERRAEVIHHALPASARAHRIAQVITVHDLAFERLPEAFDRGYRTFARRAHRRAAQRAHGVICVSAATAADAVNQWGVDAERIVVAHHGPGQALPGGIRLEPRHFLYVGDDEPRKDLGTLLAAYELYRAGTEEPLPLVLAGPERWGRQAPGVRVEPGPDPGRLSELYREAIALVHTSRLEGFGMTALEAMSLGTPVLCAQTDAALEVCGDAALYASVGDAASFAGAMGRIAGSEELREELTRLAVARVDQFSWDACAERHAAAYSLAVEVQGR